MTIVPFPNVGITRVVWDIDEPAQVNRSDLTGHTSRLLRAGERRYARVELVSGNVRQLEPWRAFFARARRDGSFRVPATEGEQLSCPAASLPVYDDGRTGNRFLHSSDFTQSAWSKINVSAPVLGQFPDPLGLRGATTLIENGVNGIHAIGQGYTAGFGRRVSASVYARYIGGRRYVQMYADNGGAIAVFDLLAGVIVQVVGTYTEARIEAADNGWYRIALIFTATATTSDWNLLIGNGPGSFSYVGAGSVIAVWGAQFQNGPPSLYSPTKTVTGTMTTAVVLSTPTPSTTWLRAGQLIGLRDRFFELAADLRSDNSGVATADFGPRLSELPQAGDYVECRNPTARMILSGSRHGWSANPGSYAPSAFDCEEDF